MSFSLFLLRTLNLLIVLQFFFSDSLFARSISRKEKEEKQHIKASFSIPLPKIPLPKLPFPIPGIFHSSPENLRPIHLTDKVDRDGIIHLAWDVYKVNGRRVKKYQIVILGRPNNLLNSGASLEQDFLIDPVEIFDTSNADTIETCLDLKSLLGQNLKNDNKRYADLAKHMLRGKSTNLFFAVRGTLLTHPIDPHIYIPDVDKYNRQKKDSSGRYLVKKFPNYTFKGSYFSSPVAVTVDLDRPPEALKLVLLEKTKAKKGKKIIFSEKTPLKSLNVIVGDAGHPKKIALQNDSEIDKIYLDRDGVLDLAWFKEKDSSIPSYPFYQIQVSKWPKFTINPQTDFDHNVVNRYFKVGENTHFIYNNFDDFIEPEAYRGKKSFQNHFYMQNQTLIRPFYSKNLAIVGFEGKNKSVDYGRPVFFNGDDYGACDGVYYLRIRAFGKDRSSKKVNNDSVYGPWSRIVAVCMKRNARLQEVHFSESPQSIDDSLKINTGNSLLRQGFIPLRFQLSNGKMPWLEKNNIYQIVISKHPNLIVNQKYIRTHFKEGRLKDYFCEYALASNISDVIAHHRVDLLFNTKVKKDNVSGRYYLWVRTVRNVDDAVPSIWSRPVNVDVKFSGRDKAIQPILKKIDDHSPLIKKGRVFLDWTLKDVQPDDPMDSRYRDKTSAKFIPSYTVIIYKKDIVPKNKNGVLRFEDKNENDVNDWLEVTGSDGIGKCYAVYNINTDQLKRTSQNGVNALYQLNVLKVYDFVRNSDGSLLHDDRDQYVVEEKAQSLERGLYYFYLFSKNAYGLSSCVSQKQVVDLPDIDVTAPPQPLIDSIDKRKHKILCSQGIIPITWTFNDSYSNVFDLRYLDSRKTTYVPSYQLIVTRDDIDPVDHNTGQLRFDDKNNNGLNDWLELQKLDKNGDVIAGKNSIEKAYASYWIKSLDMLSQNKADKTFYHVPLFLRCHCAKNAEGKLFFSSHVENISAAHYSFYLISHNAYDCSSKVSPCCRIDLPDIKIKRPPQPQLDDIDLEDKNIALGKIPLSWTLKSQPHNPRDSIYSREHYKVDGSLAINPKYIGYYSVIVLRSSLDDSPPKDTICIDENGKLEFSDANANGINDWLEHGYTQNGTAVYGVYNIWSLLDGKDSDSSSKVLARIPLDKIFHEKYQYSQTIPKGRYSFYIYSVNSVGQKSLMSHGQSLKIKKSIAPALFSPQPLIKPISSQISDGQVSLSWTLETDPSDPRDPLYLSHEISQEEKMVKNVKHIPSYHLFVYRTELGESLSKDNFPYEATVLKVSDFKKFIQNPKLLLEDLKKKGYLSSDSRATDFFKDSNNLKDFRLDVSFLAQKQTVFRILQQSLSRLKFVDKNHNNVNDFLELDEKLYSDYVIKAGDILPVSEENLSDVLYRVRLFEKFRPIHKISNNKLSTEFKKEVSPIKKGRYHFFLRSQNIFGEESVFSLGQFLDVHKEIPIFFPPKVTLIRPKAIDEYSLSVQNQGLIPVAWKLGDAKKSPIDSSLTGSQDPNAIAFYRVLFFLNLDNQDMLDSDGFLRWKDLNHNNANDWTELAQSGQRNHLFTTFLISTEELKQIAQNELKRKDSENQTLEDMPCCYSFPLYMIYKPDLDENGNKIPAPLGGFSYSPHFQTIPSGQYTLFVSSINNLGLEGPLSDAKMLTIEKEIPVMDIPRKIILDSIVPNPDHNGIVGLNWHIDGDDKIKDRLDLYYAYEINISKGSLSWNHDDYAVEFVKTFGKNPLMIPSETNGVYEKASPWPWVRNLKDLQNPLHFVKSGDIEEGGNVLTNDVSQKKKEKMEEVYYFRVRALSQEGSFSASGPWSNIENVTVLDDARRCDVPLIDQLYPPSKQSDQRSDYIPIGLLLKDSIYAIYYKVNYSNLSSNQSNAILEVIESEDQNFSSIYRTFYLDVSAFPDHPSGFGKICVFKQSLFDTNPIVQKSYSRIGIYGKTFYYKARMFFMRNDTPDRLNDELPSLFSRIVRVNIPNIDELENIRETESSQEEKTWNPI